MTPASTRVALTGLLTALAATLVAGCGGSSGPTTAGYDGKVATICNTYEKKVKALASGSSQTQAEAWVSHTYGILQTVTTRIDNLKEPSSHVRIDAAKGDERKAVADLASVLEAIKAGKVSAFESDLTAFETDVDRAGTAWDKAGVKACGS